MNDYSKDATETYKEIMRKGNFALICFMYLESRAFKDKVVSWIQKRWKGQSDKFILDDLLSRFEVNHGPLGRVNQTALAFMTHAGKIGLIPIEVFKLIPVKAFNEKVVRSRGSFTQDLDVLTLREYLTWKRNCPKVYKEIIK